MKAASVLGSLCVVMSMVIAMAGKKKAQEPLNRETTPFWLRDTADGMCFGPDGFGACGLESLWILAARDLRTTESTAIVSMFAPEPDRMCLGSESGGWLSSRQPMGVFKCGKSGTKNLVLATAGNTAEETYLLARGKAGKVKDCVARAVGPLRSSADMQPCTKGTVFSVVSSSSHDAGMQIATVDGMCFDGVRFRRCNDADRTLRWGVGIDFRKTEPSRQLFAFFDKEKCAVRDGQVAEKAACSNKGARMWGWKSGQLTQGGSHCLGRTTDNKAIFVPCTEGYEQVTFRTPDVPPGAMNKFGENMDRSTAGGGSYRKPASTRRFDL